MPALTHLLYLHGFRSSPQSTKARRLAELVAQRWLTVHWWCPQLPPSPRLAASLIQAGTAHWPALTMAVVGSSLGGFYATWLAQQRGCRAVLINPAVDPARDLARHIGEQSSWHDPAERFFFEPHFVEELRAMEVGPLAYPERLLAVIATGDEVLDWREMQARYTGAHQRIVPGSDHALSDLDDHLPAIGGFLAPEGPPLH
jgi:predicted esterase YcpF (UPF0227 family)